MSINEQQLSFNMVEYILLSGIIISCFLSLILTVKKNKSVAEYLLLCWIFSSGYVTFSYLLVHNGSYLNHPTLTAIGFCIPLLPGPFIYLYIKYQTQPLFFEKKDLLHFLPFLLFSLLFSKFYLMPHETKVAVLHSNGKGFEVIGAVKTYAIFISGIAYTILSFLSLYLHKKNLRKAFSTTEGINFNWLLLLNTGLLVVWTVVLSTQNDSIIFSTGAIYIIFIGFFGATQSNVFSEREVRYFQARIGHAAQEEAESPIEQGPNREASNNTAQLEEVYQQTIDLIKKDKLYLNPELKLLDLAIVLNYHPNQISKAINSVSDANFYDLVNKMRVEEFMSKVKNGAADQFTILSLALDSGFNSKASFNRNFKAITGGSPSEFLKQV
jgi:AraC-like DNA-binding protein